MLAFFLSLLTSGGLATLANAVIAVINKRTDLKIEQVKADGVTGVAAINAAVPILQAQADIYKSRWGWWGTRYMALGASVPAIIHTGAIYLDSTFKLGWAIARAPGIYEGLEVQIILGCVGILSAQAIFARR